MALLLLEALAVVRVAVVWRVLRLFIGWDCFLRRGLMVSCCWGKFGSIAGFDKSGSGKKAW